MNARSKAILYAVIGCLMVVDFTGAWAISSAVVRRHYRTPVPVAPAAVRPWVEQPWFGTVIAGVALGKLVTIASEPPSPDAKVCWFWATEARTQGYWDYCKAPHPLARP